MPPGEPILRRRGLALALAGTVMWSLAGLFARLLAHVDVWTVMGARAGFGFLSISVIGLYEWRRGRLDNPFGFGPLSLLISALAMSAICCYVAAIMTTSVADVMVIYATLPFVAAGLGVLVNREPVSPRTLIASAIALVGILVMVANGIGPARLAGMALALLMTVSFAGMIVLQRRQPELSMIAVNAIGAAGAAVLGFSISPHPPLGAYDLAVLFVYGLMTIGVGFVTFMEGAKLIPSAEAGLISMLDVVLGPFWVFVAFGENPGAATIAGGLIVLAAAVWRMAPDLVAARSERSNEGRLKELREETG